VALAVRNLVVANKSYENLNRQLAVFFAHLDIKVVGNAAEFQGDAAREGLRQLPVRLRERTGFPVLSSAPNAVATARRSARITNPLSRSC
jgi:hypothetical protein